MQHHAHWKKKQTKKFTIFIPICFSVKHSETYTIINSKQYVHVLANKCVCCPDSGHERRTGGDGIGNGTLDGEGARVHQIFKSGSFWHYN